MEVAKNANELVTNLKATRQKLRLNFERVRSHNIELEKNTKSAKIFVDRGSKRIESVKYGVRKELPTIH